MYQLINKDDFSGIVKWSSNIPERDVNFYCVEAQKFDTYPIMPIAKVSGNSIVLDIETAIQESPITKPELVNFYNEHVKPFIVCKAYERLLLLHGRNVTQFGLRVNSEETSNEISDKARGEWIEQTAHKANVYMNDMFAKMKEANFTFDGVAYIDKSKKKTISRINAI